MTAALSIGGAPLNLVRVDEGSITVRTRLRLCPGRRVSVRVGRARASAVAATIVSSCICALDRDGPTYVANIALEVAEKVADLVARSNV